MQDEKDYQYSLFRSPTIKGVKKGSPPLRGMKNVHALKLVTKRIEPVHGIPMLWEEALTSPIIPGREFFAGSPKEESELMIAEVSVNGQVFYSNEGHAVTSCFFCWEEIAVADEENHCCKKGA